MKIDRTQRNKIARSLSFSIYDGSFFAMMVGFGESFFAAFGILLQASNILYGLLLSLPQALGSFSQLLSTRIAARFQSRKHFVITGAILQGLMYIPLALLCLLRLDTVPWLIFIVCCYFILGSIINPIWNSWMGDLVPEKMRGRYFGKRYAITGSMSFFSYITAGAILQYFSFRGEPRTGFLVIFSLAFIVRMSSIFFLAWQYEPEGDINELRQALSKETFTGVLSDKFFHIMLFLVCMNTAVALASPFFVPYMLKYLQYSYWQFTVVNATVLLVKFIFMRIWGRLADRYGNRVILVMSSVLISFAPALWAVSSDFFYLVLIQIYAGITWAAFEITSFNYIFDATSVTNRPAYVGYYNALNGLGVLAGALTGGVIMHFANFTPHRYLMLFIISSILRLGTAIYFLPKIKELRLAREITMREFLFKLFTFRTGRGLVYQLFDLNRTNRGLPGE
ncbi:MAG: MFS transporter [Candidatus Margulisiibacteriota bacterium]